MILAQLIILAVTIAQAIWNVYLRNRAIRNNNPIAIRHGWQTLGWLAVCAVVWWFVRGWPLVACFILIRIITFTPLYNMIYKLPLFRVSPTSASIEDRILIRIGGWKASLIFRIIALVALITLNILYV